MAEIKEGYYVRLVNGRIRKVTGIYGRTYFLQANDLQKFECECKAKDIVKYGKELIDIIERGDYVNGCEVIQVTATQLIVRDENGLSMWDKKSVEKHIKYIVTKEQFEKGKYFVEA